MASFPEVIIPPQDEQYDPENEGNDDEYVKKPRVDTKRIFKSKKGANKVEEELAEMRHKPRPVYDNPMEEVKVMLSKGKKKKEVKFEKIEELKLNEEPEPVTQSPQSDEDEAPPELEVKPKNVEPPSVVASISEMEDEDVGGGELIKETPSVVPKKKRKMTQKQLDALARGRANSLKNRQARAQTKKEMKSSGPVLDTINDAHESIKTAPIRVEPKNYLTKEDVKNISVEAITEYDAIRKKRKDKKKEIKSKHIADVKTTQAINRALNPNDMDFYGSCFNISY